MITYSLSFLYEFVYTYTKQKETSNRVYTNALVANFFFSALVLFSLKSRIIHFKSRSCICINSIYSNMRVLLGTLCGGWFICHSLLFFQDFFYW
jgi:hypothetical protein